MSGRKTILADQRELEAMQALANMFTKADRVLTGDHNLTVGVKYGASYPAPAWSDGINITFNGDMIDSLTDAETLVRVFGLNYHEMAHHLFTPRLKNTTFGNAIQYEGLKMSFNVLEDQRIETLLTGIYPSTIPYLVSTFMRYCIASEAAWKTNYALAYGRRFIPADVRRAFRSRFSKQAILPQLERIIDDYRLLVFPKHEDRALELIREFHQLLTSNNVPPIHDPNGHTEGRPDITKGTPDGVRKQQQASDAASELDDALDDAEDDDLDDGPGAGGEGDDTEDADDDTASEGGEGGQGDGEDTDDESSDGTSSDEEDFDDSDDDWGNGTGDISDDADGTYGDPSDDDAADDGGEGTVSSDTESDQGGGKAGQQGDSDDLSDDELRQLFDDVRSQAEDDDDLTSEVESAQRTISGRTGLGSNLPRKTGMREMPVYSEDVAAVRKFASVLDRLRQDTDPGWNQYQRNGRLNVQRVIQGAKFEEAWDRWEPGHSDATDIECVIAIDTSISMRYQVDAASRALWVIKRALESLNAKVTVFSFDNKAYTVYKKDERVNHGTYRFIPAGGGTVPTVAVQEAVRILDSSDSTTRIFIAITDGDWGYGYGFGSMRDPNLVTDMSADDMIAAMNHHNITTALAFIPDAYDDDDVKITTHNCQVVGSVHDPLALTGFAKKVVAQAVKDTISAHRA